MGAQRVFLHVGSPKTGTTYLQGILWRNRERLWRQGLLLPLDTLGDHYAGSFEVGGHAPGQQGPRIRGRSAEGAWQRLVDSSLAWDGDVLISHEMYQRASADQARAAMAPFLAAGREVHVIVTARDLGRQITAAWQERVKVGGQMTFATYVERIEEQPSRHLMGRSFWRAHDTAGIAGRWGGDLPPSQVHVVTVPPSGAPRDLLWRRFAGVLGIDDAGFDLGTYANESLHLEQVELARRVNVLIDRTPLAGKHAQSVKRLYERMLAPRPGTAITLGAREREFARRHAEEIVARLRKRGVDVVGSLDDLVPAEDGDDIASARRPVGTARVVAEAFGSVVDLAGRGVRRLSSGGRASGGRA